MDKLVFGTAGIPIKTEPRTYINAFNDLLDLGLGCMEIEFVRGVNMNPKTQVEVKEKAPAMGLALTAHGPYYIKFEFRGRRKKSLPVLKEFSIQHE
jgi:Endonuclease IV